MVEGRSRSIYHPHTPESPSSQLTTGASTYQDHYCMVSTTGSSRAPMACYVVLVAVRNLKILDWRRGVGESSRMVNKQGNNVAGPWFVALACNQQSLQGGLVPRNTCSRPRPKQRERWKRATGAHELGWANHWSGARPGRVKITCSPRKSRRGSGGRASHRCEY